MYATRYFAQRYFAPRYFGEGGSGASAAGSYFGRRYFGARYFAPRYFSIRADATPPTPTPEQPGGGAGRGAKGAGRRWFPFPNYIDDPNLFAPEPIKEPEKAPEPVAQQPYPDGDDVRPGSSLAAIGLSMSIRHTLVLPQRRADPEPAVEEEAHSEEEEELLVLKYLEIL